MGHLPVGQCQIGNHASTVSEKLRPPFIFVADASLSTYGGREVRPEICMDRQNRINRPEPANLAGFRL